MVYFALLFVLKQKVTKNLSAEGRFKALNACLAGRQA
jgi:hypothetical protein